MNGFKVKKPMLGTSISVLAVMLMTSGAVAEDEITAGTEPEDGGISYEIYPPTDPIYVIDPLPADYPEDGIVDGGPDPDDGTGDDGIGDDGTVDEGTIDVGEDDGALDDVVMDDGATGDGEVIGGDGEVGTGDPEVEVTFDGGLESECGGCEDQNSAGPEMPAMPGSDVVQRSVRRSATGTTAVKNSCLDPERYVAWMCDWQKDLGLIGQ